MIDVYKSLWQLSYFSLATKHCITGKYVITVWQLTDEKKSCQNMSTWDLVLKISS